MCKQNHFLNNKKKRSICHISWREISSKYKNNDRNQRKKKTGHIKSKKPATKNTKLKSKITRKTYLQKSDKQLMCFTHKEINIIQYGKKWAKDNETHKKKYVLDLCIYFTNLNVLPH